ncbi:hypothetical protein D1O33_03385 [Rhodococcus rhodochrous]|uniref:hypothetical protein n=1 Tax=Rhodococcus rhodochrous TaxID=1829 RepID=UPI00132EE03C|nr:hypothetical protein [Rhodococcus rhodochrous]QHG81086.1 hypothetical protein D1O33_03385 [Rhodococcus rhodochrous]
MTAVDVGTTLRLTLDRLCTDSGVLEYELAFDTPDGCDDFPAIDAGEIPALIDALSELYRAYCTHAYQDDVRA